MDDLSPEDLKKKLDQGAMITMDTNPSTKGDGARGWLRDRFGMNDHDPLYKNGTLAPSHVYMVKDVTPDGQVVLVNPWDGNKTITVPYSDLKRACTYGEFSVNSFK